MTQGPVVFWANENGDANADPLRPSHAALRDALNLPEARLADLPGDCLFLLAGPAGIELRAGEAPGHRGTRVALRPPSAAGRLTRSQPLARAIGPGRRRIADATAGWGEDAARLAGIGHEVIAIERSPILAALLADGLERAAASDELRELASRIELVRGDAIERLPELDPAPDVVYIDPMFPPKRSRSALPPKPMQLLQRLVGIDQDVNELLSVALAHCRDRVVVKRPRSVASSGPPPTVSYGGKLVRYDVYYRDARTTGSQDPG